MSQAVADAHVDVLMRVLQEGLSFTQSRELTAGLPALQAGSVAAQVFALFVWPNQPANLQLEQVLQEIDLFYELVVSTGAVRPAYSWADLQAAKEQGQIAGFLSLEGGGCLRGRVDLLRTLYRLGVRGMGLTWNGPNELADGCREARGAGLTQAGREVVSEMVRLGMWVDIAHLSDRGVDDILALTQVPVMASHANARAVHEHPRNLTDEVIREIVHRKGWIGLTFEASFVGDTGQVGIDDVFLHLDHLLKLGAEDVVGFGSDFDGTAHPLEGLASAADYATLTHELVTRYGIRTAEKVSYGNFERYLRDNLH